METAKRLKQVKPSLTLAIAARAAALKAEGKDIISFSIGEPDFDTPQSVVDAAKKALDEGFTKYTPVAGMPALRAEIAKWYETEFGIPTTSDNVVVSVGGKQVLYNAIMAFVDPGDRVLIPAPYWLSYPAQVNLAGAKPIFVETTEEEAFVLNPERLEKAILEHKPKMLILNTPSNPTGQAYNAEELKKLAKVLRAHPDVIILWDNIYAHLTYGDFEHVELGLIAPDLRQRIIVCGGFSKSFAMTGWRLGFGIADPSAIKAMSSIQGHSTSNATSFAQAGSIAALKLGDEFKREICKTFEGRRQCILKAIDKIDGLTCLNPRGAFYALVNCKSFFGKSYDAKLIKDDVELAEFILNQAHVATVPGSAFGAPGYLRLSFAMNESKIEEGLQRIGIALKLLSRDK